MKLRIDVTRADGNTINGLFDSQAAADAWIQDHKAEWGTDAVAAQPAVSEVKDADGNITTPAQPAVDAKPATYSYTQTDLTAQDDHDKKVFSRKEIREACLDVLDEIAALNSDGGATDDQMDQFFTTQPTLEIAIALLAGSPKAASRQIQKVGPSLYPQAVVDDIVAKLAPLFK